MADGADRFAADDMVDVGEEEVPPAPQPRPNASSPSSALKSAMTTVAKGLAVFLNSTLVDVYFRQFNGHTQVNATDLRSLNYPTRVDFEALGRKIGDAFPEQAALDEMIQREFF